jgi:branched-chain amino acid transport system ATP-binding protein
VLQVKDLEVYYGHIRALKGISFNIKKGEIVTVIGSNGAGKSTTLMSIAGLIRPSNGSIAYLEKDITLFDPYTIVRSGISMCPEGRRIFSNLTVRENLIMGAVQRKDKKAVLNDIGWVLSLFPALKDRLGQIGGTLSGGEQQMLAISRALMNRPPLLLLDEPSLGLAPLLVKKIFEVIVNLKKSGTTVLLVEQNAKQALDIADRGYVMETGYISIEGTSDYLKHHKKVQAAYLGG